MHLKQASWIKWYPWSSLDLNIPKYVSLPQGLPSKVRINSDLALGTDREGASLVAQLVKNPPTMKETPVFSIPGSRRSPGEGRGCPLQYSWMSLVAQLLKNPPAMRETWVWSLGWEDPLKEGTANPLQYSCLEKPLDRSLEGCGPWGHKESDVTEHGTAQPSIMETLGALCLVDTSLLSAIPSTTVMT